jgi:hypothetical protein
MARRVALARAIALDPDLVLYDEPFAGLDPISLGVAARLIRDLNDALGLTSVIVSHDLHETFEIADVVAMSPTAAWWRRARPMSCGTVTTRWCASSWARKPTGRCASTSRPSRWPRTSGCSHDGAGRIGAGLRPLVDVGGPRGCSSRCWPARPERCRFVLVREQIFYLGNRSLSIIGVSGLFVGFVLALQGYYTLQRYGSPRRGPAGGAEPGARAGRWSRRCCSPAAPARR